MNNLDDQTKAELIGMIDLWLHELKTIKAEIIAKGGVTKIDELRIKRISREINESREALAKCQTS